VRNRLTFFRFVRVCAACLGVWSGAALLSATPAAAEFTICNLTDSTVGVAVGYDDNGTWVTEGWWTLPPPAGDEPSCVTPEALAGPLRARYYYVYAVDYTLGGEWTGDHYMCTQDTAFTIRGNDNCVARGYDRTGFAEIDTSDREVHIVQLTDDAGAAGP
jgi:uncharacterized membrane protein